MRERYMLDTNIVSYILSGRSPAARVKLASLTIDEVACISVMTEGELRYGLAKTPDAHLRRSALDGFLAKIQILPWEREEAAVYGAVRARQYFLGKLLGNMDMLIAAHAIASRSVLVTNDRAFAQVEQLYRTENWATDLIQAEAPAARV